MPTAVVIDDMKNARDVINSIISIHCPDIEIVGEAGGVSTGKKLIQDTQPDIVILDVQMNDGTGFDILKTFKPIDFKVIFVSAYDSHALQAFKFSALDYILKPIDSNELVNAISKTRAAIQKEDISESLDVLQNNYAYSNKESKKIVLKTSDSIYVVSIKDILHCQSEINYTNFFLADGRKILISRPLKDFDEILNGYGFFRIHQSHLINLDYFEQYKKADGGFVVLKNSVSLPVSSRKRADFLKVIQQI